MSRFHLNICSLLAILLAPAVSQAGTVTTYSINALGAAFPSDINNAGQVVGNVRMGNGEYQGVIYSGGSVQYVGTLDGSYSHASAINNSGDVVGYAEVAGGGQAAFLYSNSTMTRIAGLGNIGSWADAINDKGEIVGSSNNGLFGSYVFKAGRNGIQTVDGLRAGLGISESGTVVGAMKTEHVASYNNGIAQDLGTLGGSYGVARKINENNQIVGVSHIAGNEVTHAFLYANGLMVDLGALGGGNSDAWDVNNSGRVVGSIEDQIYSGGGIGFVYSDGVMSDLNTLIDPATGWSIYHARAINDSGQIAAWGCSYRFGCQTLRLDPTSAEIPEPGTLGLFSIAFLTLATTYRGRRNRGRGA